MSEMPENDNNILEQTAGPPETQTMEPSQTTPEPVEQRKGFHIFYLFPMAYVLSVYVMVVCICADIIADINQIDIPDFFEYCIFLPLVFAVCNLVVAIAFCKPKNRIMMLNAAVFVKYSLIPFFLLGAIVEFCTFFIPVPIPLLGPTFALMLGVVGWLIMIFGSPYVFAYLHLSRKQKIRSIFKAIVHGILQFFFTVDVIDVMVLTLREHRWKKVTIVMIILTAIWAAIFLPPAIFFIFQFLK